MFLLFLIGAAEAGVSKGVPPLAHARAPLCGVLRMCAEAGRREVRASMAADVLLVPQPPTGFTWSKMPELAFAGGMASTDAELPGPPVELVPAEASTAARSRPGPLPAEASTAARSYPPPPTLGECLAFIIPALGIYTAGPLLSLIDAGFIGRISATSLAALGPACTISDSAAFLLLFLSIAATNLVARDYSQADTEGMARTATSTLGLGIVLGSVLGAVMYASAAPLATLYCGAGEEAAAMVHQCIEYVRVRSLALPAAVVASIAQSVLIGTKDSRTPMISVLTAAAVNLATDFILVTGAGLGVLGAAAATSFSQFAAAWLLMRTLSRRGFLRLRGLMPLTIQTAGEHDSSSNAKSMRAVAYSIASFTPFLYVMQVKLLVHNSMTAAAASLGGAQAAAHTALLSIAMFCFTFGDVGSSMAQAFLPAFYRDETTAEGKPTKATFDLEAAKPTFQKLLRVTWCISASVVAVATAIILCGARLITTDQAVVMQMRKLLPLMAGTLTMHGSAVTLEGLLLAKKDFGALCTVYSAVAVCTLASQWLVRHCGAGLIGVWAIYIGFQILRIMAFTLRSGLVVSTVRQRTGP